MPLCVPPNWMLGSNNEHSFLTACMDKIPPLLYSIPNICWCFSSKNPKIFIYGVSDIWEIINNVLDELSFVRPSNCGIEKGELYAIIRDIENTCDIRINIVLKLYKNIEEILSSFTIPIEAVIYAEEKKYLTEYTKNSLDNYTITVNQDDEAYLESISRYFEMGFALILPDLNPELFTLNKTIKIGGITLYSLLEINDSFIAKIEYEEVKKTFNTWQHIYDTLIVSVDTNSVVNTISYLKGDASYKFIIYILEARRIKNIKMHDILPVSTLENSLHLCSLELINNYDRLYFSINLMINVFKFTRNEIEQYSQLCLVPEHKELRKVFVWKKIQKIVNKYKNDNPILDFILNESSDSINYEKKENIDMHQPVYYNIVKALHNKSWIAPTGIVYNEECAFCMETISRGESNSVILPCGHIFHLYEIKEECGGMQAHAKNDKKCPICKRSIQL